MLKRALFILLLLPVLASCKEEAPAEVKESSAHHKQGTYTVLIETQSGDTQSFKVELALTPDVQAKGLMHRTQLDNDAGMLFYFGEEREQAFWMKNTLIPLDIIFVKQTGRIHHIHPNAIPRDLTRIPSMGTVAAVLEINGGLSRELGIQPGDMIKHPFFSQNNAQ